MALLDTTYDINTLPSGNTGDFSPLPPGWYTAAITQADLRPTKDGTGQYVAVRYDITGPTHQGRVVYANLNIKNKNPKAEEIARQQLGDIMRAIGMTQVRDTDELLGAQLQIKLKIREQEGYEPSNDVSGWKSIGGSAPSAPSVSSSSAPSQNSATKAPWQR